MMLCAKFGWNKPSDSGGEGFLNFFNLFSLFRSYLPLEKGGVLHLNYPFKYVFCNDRHKTEFTVSEKLELTKTLINVS